MDGNSRWATARCLPRLAGYQRGVEALRRMVRCCQAWGVPCLTVYAFSAENWQRGGAEVSALLALMGRVLATEVAALATTGVRLRFVGELERLPEGLQAEMRSAERATEANSELHLSVAVSYSGRADVTAAARRLAARVAAGQLAPQHITAGMLEAELATAALPLGCRHPDLIVRTSGERRLSNFLCWEAAYSELFFSETLWPDFREAQLAEALRDYAQRERRFGGRRRGGGGGGGGGGGAAGGHSQALRSPRFFGAMNGAPTCPLRTVPGEPATREIRAYKLGKKRWSYNQVELLLGEASGSRAVKVKQATLTSDAKFAAQAQDSAACFHVQLESGHRLQAHFYVVYDGEPPAAPVPAPAPAAAAAEEAGEHPGKVGGEPASGSSRRKGAPTAAPAGAEAAPESLQQQRQRQQQQQQQQQQPSGSAAAPADDGGKPGPAAEAAGAEDASSSASATAPDGLTSWSLVVRQRCCKGCQGCILRSVKRFGRLGKRSWSDDPEELDIPTVVSHPHEMKDPRNIYLAIDEACTHVGAAAFRLLAGVYDISGERLLATAVSPPIRVLANNDVPTGAARIPIDVQLPADWEGWNATPEPEAEAAPAAVKRARRPRPRKAAAGAHSSPDPASGSASQGSSQGRSSAGRAPAAQHAQHAHQLQQQQERHHSLPIAPLNPAFSLRAPRPAHSLPAPAPAGAAPWQPAPPPPASASMLVAGHSFSMPAGARAPHPPLSLWQAQPQFGGPAGALAPPAASPFASHAAAPQPSGLSTDPSCQPAWAASAQLRQQSLPQYSSSLLSGSTAVPADSGQWQHQQQALSAVTAAHHHQQLMQQLRHQQQQCQQLAAAAAAVQQQQQQQRRQLTNAMVQQHAPQAVVPQPGGWLSAGGSAVSQGQFGLPPAPAELAPLSGPDLASIFDDLLGPALPHPPAY
ncbi:UDP pyrophosphate synthase [Micractinium conductrix]|uniref:UDP pyrophosphate synthase n=1 Tax=Micractinium conductrix TaxID=554055 RepID=A0A2P6V4A6_9CHLO|nr:UDP pyrophosphate synthase [Micractinium conductrix]|eukprot:PSC68915.1 UDP pyrophosphate synthase [Micractinium conductrix]